LEVLGFTPTLGQSGVATKIEPYFYMSLKLFFFDFQMHILGISSWVPINMDFIGFDI
jgi:hypothetical protein